MPYDETTTFRTLKSHLLDRIETELTEPDKQFYSSLEKIGELIDPMTKITYNDKDKLQQIMPSNTAKTLAPMYEPLFGLPQEERLYLENNPPTAKLELEEAKLAVPSYTMK